MEVGTNQKSNVRLFRDGQIQACHWPIVYSDSYNITFFGMERLHPFDSTKWRNVFNFLKDKGMITDKTVVEPLEVNEEELLQFHSQEYLNSLKWSANVARITEVPPVAFLFNSLVQRKLLKKLRFQTGGSILAAKLALDRGWAINIGGGFHHCSETQGGGFCVYADISGALKILHEQKLIRRALIVDLDAHQGNGHERDFLDTPWVTTLDVYNGRIYPGDIHAKAMKNLRSVEIRPYTKDDEFLRTVNRELQSIMDDYKDDSKPDIVAYNAGTDILEGDPLGCLSISAEGIKKRDELVFQMFRDAKIPIFMVLSGGYQRHTAEIIADSILNLRDTGLISTPEA